MVWFIERGIIMRVGQPIASDDNSQLWPVEQKTFKTEFVSHFRDSFYRKVFTGYETIGMFKSAAAAQEFIDKKRTEL
jgi:hypothetical protein